VPDSNPIPTRFTVLDWQYFRNRKGKLYLLVKVKYPDATNFDGIKVMLYQGFAHVDDLLNATNNELDPHFSEHGISPIARFPPTDAGWRRALRFAGSL
jgi:hypothetical protein